MVKKCPVCLHLSWFGTPLVRIENKIKASLEKCFFAVEQRVIFTSRPLLPAIGNGLLPALLLSNVVCGFSCHCGNWCVGRASRRLRDGVCQHVPEFVGADRVPSSRGIFASFGESSARSCLVGLRLVGTFWVTQCASEIAVMRVCYFFIWSFVFSFICFRSRLHQIIQAKFMPPKTVCLQLENLPLIMRFDAFLKHPIIFVRLY